METNTLVRAAHVRELYRTLGEAREILWSGSRERAKEHVIGGLCRILGGSVGAIIVDDDHGPGRRGRLVELSGHNMQGTDMQVLAREYFLHGSIVDPALKPLRRRDGEVVTMLREELIDDRAWTNAPFVAENRRQARLGDALYSKRRTSRRHVIDGLCLNRAWGERSFDVEDRNLVHLCQLEAPWLYARATAADGPLARDLAPREKETLALLLSGAGEKEIAAALRLSRHTVHGYVKSIYRHFGARSRAQLLALRRRAELG